MATHSYALDSTATPDTVWRIWSKPEAWPEWNPDVEWVKLDGPFAAGTTGRMKTKRGGEHAIRLEEISDGRAFQLESTALPGAKFHFRCEIVPSGSGSRISQSLTMRGPLAGLFSAIMGGKIAASFEPILRGLARQAEAGA